LQINKAKAVGSAFNISGTKSTKNLNISGIKYHYDRRALKV